MIDVTCPMCCAVYHSEPIHLGKHINCPRCGSLVPILATTPGAVMERGSPIPNSPTYQTRPKDFSIRPRRHRRIYYSAALGLTLAVILVVYFRQAAIPERQASAGDSIPAGQSSSSAKPTVSETEAGSYRLEDVEEAPVKTPHAGASKGSSRLHMLAPSAGEHPTEYRSLPNGTRISPDVGSDGHGLLRSTMGRAKMRKLCCTIPLGTRKSGKSTYRRGIPYA